MLQLNLLPDVKLEYLKARRMKHKVYIGSLIAVGASVGILVILLSLVTIQKKNISDLTKDIKTEQKALEAVPDLAKILTIQNQLNTLPGLYNQRPVTSRLFTYIQQTTPTPIKLTSVKVEYETSTMTIQGTAENLEQVNLFVDTLKFTKYTVNDDTNEVNAFTEVTLSEFTRTATTTTFKITMKFDPAIFDASNDVTLVVPKTVTTRSQTELPTDIFAPNPTETEQ